MKSKCGNFVLLDKDAAEVVDKLLKKNAALQAKIDSLMLEYCPNDMTSDQLSEYCKHQEVKTLCSERECKEHGCAFPDCIDLNRSDSLQTWFGLSYASWLTLPRVLMTEMPSKWQNIMGELLHQYDEAMSEIHKDYEELSITVSVKKNNRFCKIPKELTDYRHTGKIFSSRIKEIK